MTSKMTKKKITIYLLMAICMFSVNSYKVNALESLDNNLDYILENSNSNDMFLENGVLNYSDEYINSMNIKNEELEKSYQRYLETKKFNISDKDNGVSLYSIRNIVPYGFTYTNRTLNVPTYQQETNYWCGPAAVKETLQFLNGSSLTQGQYANNMGTNSSIGTYVYKIRDELNSRQSKHYYQYEDINSETRFTQILIATVMNSDVGVPFILHAVTGSLYRYNGNSLNHYLVVNGGDMANQKVTYVDSWAADYGRGTTLGRYTDSRTNVANTVTAANRFVIW